MTREIWSEFIDAHPHARQVVLRIPPETSDLVPLRVVQNAARRALKRSGAQGYNLTIYRMSGCEELHCAFARGEDAQAFVLALRGEASDAPDDANRTVIDLDDAVCEALERLAGPPERPRRPPPPSQAW